MTTLLLAVALVLVALVMLQLIGKALSWLLRLAVLVVVVLFLWRLHAPGQAVPPPPQPQAAPPPQTSAAPLPARLLALR